MKLLAKPYAVSDTIVLFQAGHYFNRTSVQPILCSPGGIERAVQNDNV